MKEQEDKPKLEDIKKAVATPKPNILTGLPAYLKDPGVYKKIQKASYEILGSICGHSEMSEWAMCVKCQKKGKDHADYLRKLGFTSPAQYYAWKLVHAKIERRVKLR
jgi:hypothetical protein